MDKHRNLFSFYLFYIYSQSFFIFIIRYDLRPLEVYAPNQYEYLYPFGYGMSYTTFFYSNLMLNSDIVEYKNGVEVSVNVKNVGSVSGKETVILYLEDVVASISRPIKQVEKFQNSIYEIKIKTKFYY